MYMYPHSMFRAQIRKIFKKNHLKKLAFKNLCIMHGNVCVIVTSHVASLGKTYAMLEIIKGK